MAHELGHLVLPWHLPQANCEVGEEEADLPVFSVEQEADVFASCLLMPDGWLLGLKQRHGDDMSQILRELNAAEVTTAAALQALRRYLLAGWIFLAYGERRIIATAGTAIPQGLVEGRAGDVLAESCHSSGEALLNGYPVRWFRMVAPAPLPTRSSTEVRADHQILMDAIAMVEPDDARRTSIAQSANGKVGGGLREAAGRPADETFQAMRHRCEQWAHSELLEEPDFLLWLAQRARAIELGETKKRRGSRG